MATNTQIKIRHGMILQAVLAQALEQTGHSFDETPAYDPDSEVPDFLIPDSKNPIFMMEVHQTDARNHFQMKTLRSVTAVAEAKAFFGPDLITVNILFGDPDSELPEANLRAMCGIFDVNLVLRRDASEEGRTAIAAMESAALELAGETGVSTAEAAKRLIAGHDLAVREFERLLKQSLKTGSVKEQLRPMWVAEKKRRLTLGAPPPPGAPTFYKKNMVRSLYFQDAHFSEMVSKPHPNTWTDAIAKQVVATGIGTVSEEIDGDHLHVDPEFLSFLKDPDAPRLRGICKDVLDSSPAMHWFFEDIRDERRRELIAAEFLLLAKGGRNALEVAIVAQLSAEIFKTIESCRCWVADLLAFRTGESQNEFNRLMVQRGRDPENYQYPFNHVSGRFERLLGCPHHFSSYARYVMETYEDVCAAKGIEPYDSIPTEKALSRGLLTLRIFGASRLQNFNPLHLLVQAECANLGIVFEDAKVKSILHDLSGGAGRLGKYDMFSAKYAGATILIVTIAAYENPRDKAKEWGARRLSTLYRLIENQIGISGLENSIFVIDGTWNQGDITRLFRSGWTHIVRLGGLKERLKTIFSITDERAAFAYPVLGSDILRVAEE